MTASSKIPPPRNLNIYRLVVARGLKQTEVALLFDVTPVRICQVVSRVRRWVDESIGDWLFPRRDDLRFYAALESAQIRIHELEGDPDAVLLVGPGWTYRRNAPQTSHSTSVPLPLGEGGGGDSETTISTTSQATNPGLPLSASPLNPLSNSAEEPIAATSGPTTQSVPQHLEQLGHRLAELLIVWQKSRRLTGAFKSWR